MSGAATEIERFLNGETPRVAGPDEAVWHDHWHDHALGGLPPVLMALRGGLMARSLSQVFIAGYQAAIRSVFTDVPDDGWAALAAAEDRKDPENHPGTVLSQGPDGPLMNGFKSWVGQSRHVRHLRVTALQGEAIRVAALDREAPGVEISHREAPAFLKELSQGFARFTDAPVTLLEGVEARDFARAEPLYIMLAAAGILAAEAGNDIIRTRACVLALGFADYLAAGGWSPKTLAALDRELSAVADVGDWPGVPGWDADRKLLSLYSPGIQKRA